MRFARDVRLQYFLSYGMLGTVLPYAPVFFRHEGFSATQIGYAYAIWSAAWVLSPGLVTLAADTRADPRRVMALALAVSGLSLLVLGFVHGTGPLLAVWTVHCLAALPLLPLQDGICFSLQRRQEERGDPVRPYHLVRVWGTIGFIVPSVLLFALLHWGVPVVGVLMSGAAFAALAVVQALRLKDPRAADRGTADGATGDGATGDGATGDGATGDGAPDEPAAAGRARAQLPTLRAAGALLLRPNLLVFCLAAFLGQMAGTMLGAFYPIYLTEQVGLSDKWVGLIANVGVVVEIFFVLSCGWFACRLGVKWLMALGLACVAVRMGLLMAFHTPAAAVGTQLFHGIQVVALGVMPQTFVNGYATERCRHSMQGVFVTLMGCGRVAGSLTAGPVAAHSLSAVFGYGAALCAAGAALTLLAFRDPAAEATAADRGAGAEGTDRPLLPALAPAVGEQAR